MVASWEYLAMARMSFLEEGRLNRVTEEVIIIKEGRSAKGCREMKGGEGRGAGKEKPFSREKVTIERLSPRDPFHVAWAGCLSDPMLSVNKCRKNNTPIFLLDNADVSLFFDGICTFLCLQFVSGVLCVLLLIVFGAGLWHIVSRVEIWCGKGEGDGDIEENSSYKLFAFYLVSNWLFLHCTFCSAVMSAYLPYNCNGKVQT